MLGRTAGCGQRHDRHRACGGHPEDHGQTAAVGLSIALVDANRTVWTHGSCLKTSVILLLAAVISLWYCRRQEARRRAQPDAQAAAAQSSGSTVAVVSSAEGVIVPVSADPVRPDGAGLPGTPCGPGGPADQDVDGASRLMITTQVGRLHRR